MSFPLPLDLASPQRDALPPILDLTPSPEAAADGRRQEEDSDVDSDVSDVDSDVDSDFEEEKSKEVREGRKKSKEVREELRSRLAREPKGPPPVCMTQYACVAQDESELSFEPGSIITKVRPSGWRGWIVGTLEGKRGYVPANYVVILD